MENVNTDEEETSLPTATAKFLLDKYDKTQASAIHDIPTHCFNRLIMTAWWIVSNIALLSRRNNRDIPGIVIPCNPEEHRTVYFCNQTEVFQKYCTQLPPEPPSRWLSRTLHIEMWNWRWAYNYLSLTDQGQVSWAKAVHTTAVLKYSGTTAVSKERLRPDKRADNLKESDKAINS